MTEINPGDFKILVTGGAGYIGSHTVVELQKQGFPVVIVDNLSNSRDFVVDRIAEITGVAPEFHRFDLADRDKTAGFFASHPDLKAVIHFAAFKAVGESMGEPLKYYLNNLDALLNVLQGMRAAGVENLVFSSSCTVYGQPDDLPVRETSPVKDAWSPYANTKQMSEQIIRFTSSSFGLRAIALRYFNPVGAHETARIGELPLGIPNNLTPFITQTAAGLHECLKVFGDDYPTPDGTAIRDYIHVTDLARAHIAAVRRMFDGRSASDFEVFNVGTGNGYSVKEVIQSFERVSGKKLPVDIVSRRPGDIVQVWADTSLANRELCWEAEKTLDEMMLSAWEWQQSLSNQ
ncbi:MAG: UDP-glucose 4-epimerase GalE [Acidobacteriota bacterium]|jgi:UDP-glucose 4-epimerase|nr:UDP-glucose 4-epimerase GalE [Acidobacteriota bacterium]